MNRRWAIALLALGLTMCTWNSSFAQVGGRQDAMNILSAMPPDLYAKVQILAKMLDQSIKAGAITDAEVRQGMMSGQLGEKLKTVNPEAERLLDEISEAMKSGKGPGEDSLMPLLEGLGISGQ